MLSAYLPPLRGVCLVRVKKNGSNGFIVPLILAFVQLAAHRCQRHFGNLASDRVVARKHGRWGSGALRRDGRWHGAADGGDSIARLVGASWFSGELRLGNRTHRFQGRRGAAAREYAIAKAVWRERRTREFLGTHGGVLPSCRRD